MNLYRSLRLPHQKAAEFRAGRTPQRDTEFLAGCGVPPGSTAAVSALAVRRVVASLGKVEQEWIRWNDRWPNDLGVLSFWDSLDFLEITLCLEEELNQPIRNADLFAAELWQGGSFTVADLVRRVAQLTGQ